jgi:hypothetical protein
MNPLPMPRRLLNALVPLPGGTPRDREPVLTLDSLPPEEPETARLQVRGAVEQFLEEGGRRFYEPMQEAEVIETPRT